MKSQKILIAAFIAFSSIAVAAQTSNRAAVWKEIEALRAQIKARENIILEPTAEDRAAHAEFLQQPDTGLIRLLPREKYDGILNVRGGGAYYSFNRLTHEYGRGSDISLQQGDLSVGFAGADYGMMAKLGNVPIEEVALENPIVQYLAQYKPPTNEPDARAEFERISEGRDKKDAIYKRHLTVIAGNTYVLRSINYSQSDVLIAFKVVRQDDDDSLILAWKMLKKYPTPRLER